MNEENEQLFQYSQFIGTGLAVEVLTERDTRFSVRFFRLPPDRTLTSRLRFSEYERGHELNAICKLKRVEPIYANYVEEDWSSTMKKVARVLADSFDDVLSRDFSLWGELDRLREERINMQRAYHGNAAE